MQSVNYNIRYCSHVHRNGQKSMKMPIIHKYPRNPFREGLREFSDRIYPLTFQKFTKIYKKDVQKFIQLNSA